MCHARVMGHECEIMWTSVYDQILFLLLFLFIFFFFFSSRSRHTRATGDWSSDVCSSDLERVRQLWAHRLIPLPLDDVQVGPADAGPADLHDDVERLRDHRLGHLIDDTPLVITVNPDRSEVRRVGKECRSRWAQCRYEKKG